MQIILIGLSEGLERSATRVLVEQGDVVLRAPDVASAYALCAEGAIPLVMLAADAIVHACRDLRMHPPFVDTFILAVVRAANGAHLAELLAAGASDFHIEELGEPVLHARLRILRAAAVEAGSRRLDDGAKTFFAMSLDLCAVGGLDGRFLFVNDAWTRTLGWSPQELCARPWIEFVHAEDHGSTEAAETTLGDGKAVISFVNRYRHKDGSYRWLEWRTVPSLRNGLVYASARDITEDRERQRLVWELSESLSATLNSIGDAVIATDASGAIARMNPVAERLTGWTLAESKGRPLGEVFAIVDGVSGLVIANPAVRALAEGRVVGLAESTMLTRRDGTRLPIADSCAPIRDMHGLVSGAVLVFRDVTASTSRGEPSSSRSPSSSSPTAWLPSGHSRPALRTRSTTRSATSPRTWTWCSRSCTSSAVDRRRAACESSRRWWVRLSTARVASKRSCVGSRPSPASTRSDAPRSMYTRFSTSRSAWRSTRSDIALVW